MKSGYRLLVFALIFVFGITLGALYAPLRHFLNQQFINVKQFAAGHPLEQETTLWQKIQNDLGIAPWRESRNASVDAEFDFRALELAAGLERILPESSLELFFDAKAAAIAGLGGMLVKTQADTGRGYSYHLLLLGFDGIVHKLIPLGTEANCDCGAFAPLNYYHIASDPTAAQTAGNSLIKVNSCGGVDWSVDSRYRFHHYLNNDGDHRLDSFWVLDATDLLRLESGTGRELERISLGEIINANPDLPVFEARLKGTRAERWQYGEAGFAPLGRTHAEVENADPDPFHTNDIDEYHGAETGLFRQGDLVLSFRSLNLLLVVRPATRRIVWYAYGLTSRQHDPDFVSAESIVVYDNNFHNPSSRILRLDATADSRPHAAFGARRVALVEAFAGYRFQQLTEGYQFFAEDNRSLVFSADHYHVGVDTRDNSVFLALRHRWREQSFLNLDIERLLTPSEFDAIKRARCQ